MKIVYVLQSIPKPHRYYIGSTDFEEVRIDEHNAGLSFHTSKFRPWRLVVSLKFQDKQMAFAFERYLKSGAGREFSKRHF